MASPTSPEPLQQFTLFPLLPPELRVKIWRSTFTPRLYEIQVKPTPAASTLVIHEPNHNVTPIDLRPVTRPQFPIILHVCREARDEVLAAYRHGAASPAAGFRSPYAFPYSLFSPALDTLFVPIALYYLNASEMQIMFSGIASLSLGLPREFILDRLAANPADVEPVSSLAVCWSDMHVKDAASLEVALRPYKALRELIVLFFEMREDKLDIRLLQAKRGQLRAVLCEPGQASVRGRYLERILEEYVELAEALNKELREMEEGGGSVDGRKRFPNIKVRIARFEE